MSGQLCSFANGNQLELLDHERLDAYRVSVELDGIVASLRRGSARGHAWLLDQVERASGSVVLNIAEGCGRTGADRARCLRIARGSLLEVDAGLTLLVNRGVIRGPTRAEARMLSTRVVAMLTRLIARASI